MAATSQIMQNGSVAGAAVHPLSPRRRRWLEPHRLLGHVLALRWIALALIIVGWFVYYPIIDNFFVSTKAMGTDCASSG